MVHNPKHKVHSFRGLLGDGAQDEINLERSNVNLAYRIVRFEIMPNLVSDQSGEHVVKIYREKQTTVPTTAATVDFSETDLLSAGYLTQHDNQAYGLTGPVVIFDNTLFSRNIYVTHTDNSQSGTGYGCNYYIELEEVPVGAATLMQIKLGTARRLISDSMGA